MKKIQLILTKVLFIITFSVLISGCSGFDKTSIPLAQKYSSTKKPTVSPTAIPMNSPTICPMTSSNESLPEEFLALKAFKDVLQNMSCFYSPEDEKNIYLNDFLSYGGAGFDAELGLSNFALLDMDGDKIPEVVLDLSFFGREGSDLYEILHYVNGKVYGHRMPHRGLEELKSDGTFIYSRGAGDWGYAKLEFTINDYEYDRITYCETNYSNKEYYVNNELSTADDFESFYKVHDKKEDLMWYEFTDESIEAELSSDN